MKIIPIKSPIPNSQAFHLGECQVIVTIDRGKWHLSISHRHRYPTWDEIKFARYEFLPDAKTIAMILPPRNEYVNFHPNCFHLHEIEEALIVCP